MPRISRKGMHHETVRECIEFVRSCLLGECTVDEAIAAMERDGVLLDAPLPTDKKESIYALCQRIVKACKADPELAEYYKTLAAAAQQAVDVLEGRRSKP